MQKGEQITNEAILQAKRTVPSVRPLSRLTKTAHGGNSQFWLACQVLPRANPNDSCTVIFNIRYIFTGLPHQVPFHSLNQPLA